MVIQRRSREHKIENDTKISVMLKQALEEMIRRRLKNLRYKHPLMAAFLEIFLFPPYVNHSFDTKL